MENWPVCWKNGYMARSPELARLFQLPDLPAQRHYEICRAYFHDETPAAEIAQRLHLHVGSVRAIVRDFARDPDVNAFFATARPGRKTSPKRDAIHQRACELRRQGATLADIRAALQREGFDDNESYLFRILHRAAWPRLAKVTVLELRGDSVRLGFEVDSSVPVHRWEVWEKIRSGGQPDSPLEDPTASVV